MRLASRSAAFKRQEPGMAIETDVAQHYGSGVVATEELVALLKPQPDEPILDIGSGIGGPARWIAAKCGVRVTGVDLTPLFCAAARELIAATGLGDRVTIIE